MSEVQVITERRAFLTVRSLAKLLACSPRKAAYLVAHRPDGPPIIPSYLIEGHRRIDPDDVDAYLARCKDTDEGRAA